MMIPDLSSKKSAARPHRETADDRLLQSTSQCLSQTRKLLAYGGLDGVVQRPLFDHDGSVFPHFAVRTEGCEIFDSLGRSYVDWVNGWGPVILGYRIPEIEEAIKRQLVAGPTLSLMHPVELEVAQRLVQMIPGAEMVAFGKNGSDAVNASLRIARAVTGRTKILQYGFHGFHEWYTCLHPQVEGIPEVMKSLVDSFPYDDLAALESTLDRYSGDVAAVIMEPVNWRMPSPGYLENVKRLTREHGCLLIFDEMVTAFRMARGGAQEYFDVIPDLTCIGKGMANGMPLSAIVGQREYMQRLPGCGFGMTFRGETLSLAAADATLQFMQREPVCQRLAETTRIMEREFREIGNRVGVDVSISGPPGRMTIIFPQDTSISQDEIRSLFCQESLKNGVMTNGNLLPSYAIDQAAIDRSLNAFEKSLQTVAQAIDAGYQNSTRRVGGFATGPRAFVSNGCVDGIHLDPTQIVVVGWMLLEDGAPDSIEVWISNGASIAAEICDRPDIASAFPQAANAVHSGYRAYHFPGTVFQPGT